MVANRSNPVLRRLDALVGEWELRASLEGQSFPGRAWTVFDWREAADRMKAPRLDRSVVS
jgi:hypothetical protein